MQKVSASEMKAYHLTVAFRLKSTPTLTGLSSSFIFPPTVQLHLPRRHPLRPWETSADQRHLPRCLRLPKGDREAMRWNLLKGESRPRPSPRNWQRPSRAKPLWEELRRGMLSDTLQVSLLRPREFKRRKNPSLSLTHCSTPSATPQLFAFADDSIT